MGKILIAGDIHGNYKSLMNSLSLAEYDEKEDKLVCVGDVVDRGKENSKVVDFLYAHKNSLYLVTGNHEYQHGQMLRYYKALAKSPEIRKTAAKLFLHFREGKDIIRTKEQLESFRCTPEERKKILETTAWNFEDYQKRFIVYTLAWEDDSLWKIMLHVMDEMCGYPYDAEHTLYEYFNGTKAMREKYEWLFERNAQEFVITPKDKDCKYKSVSITHSNPFGKASAWDKDEMRPDHRNILYLFGHIPHENIARMHRETSGCTYIDLDTSCSGKVTVVDLQDMLLY